MPRRQRSRSRSSVSKSLVAATADPLDGAQAAPPQGTLVATPIIHEDRDARIAALAYARAEQRGFEPGHALDDWLWAEREIDAASSSRSGHHDVG